MKNQLDMYSIKFDGISQDNKKDSSTVSVEVFGTKIKFPLTKAKKEVEKTPSGTYQGDKTVLGQKISAKVVVHSDTSVVDLHITGAATIDCLSEKYTITNDQVTLPDSSKQGDCVHDALQKHHVKLNNISYNESADSIQMELKMSFITIKFNLSHVSLLYLSPPSGTQTGEKKVIGDDIKAQVVIHSDTSMLDLKISGAASIDCPNEKFIFSNDNISLQNISISGDCVHDTLDKQHLKLDSIKYNEGSNSIEMKLKMSLLTITFDLTSTTAFTIMSLDL